MRVKLHEMGHPQPATPIQVDNYFSAGIASNEIKQKHSKGMEMRFHWICDRNNHGHYSLYWRPGYTKKRTNIPRTTHQPIIGMSDTTNYIKQMLSLTKLTTW